MASLSRLGLVYCQIVKVWPCLWPDCQDLALFMARLSRPGIVLCRIVKAWHCVLQDCQNLAFCPARLLRPATVSYGTVKQYNTIEQCLDCVQQNCSEFSVIRTLTRASIFGLLLLYHVHCKINIAPSKSFCFHRLLLQNAK